MRLYLLSMALMACRTEDKIQDNTQDVNTDADGDGFFESEDCNDLSATDHPGAPELCDGADNNCDGQIDEDVQTVFYVDSDEDGYGNPEITTLACEQPDGFVATGTDCNDASPSSYPGAEELCDALDNDCDDIVDEDLDIDFFVDEDGDGFGDDDQIVSGCAPEQNLTTVGGDCNDFDPGISPVANELCDNIDNNCDGSIDEGVLITFYADSDQDGYGDPNNTVESCELELGYVDNNSDCNDVDSNVHPAAEEVCDQQDNDCDGETDEEGSIGGSIWYEDGDNDTYGDPNDTKIACEQPSGYVSNNTDCDDNNGIFHPGAAEMCNGFDDNCDGQIDEEGALDAPTWYLDADGDNFGDVESSVMTCAQPSGFVTDNTDCDDQDNDIFPGASEVCNSEDDDCDGSIDEEAIDFTTYYEDNDDDGYGNAAAPTQACVLPDGFSITMGDCDDTRDDVSPVSDEVCDGVDNDCDGNLDENTAIDAETWYLDYDSDGFGASSVSVVSCEAPSGFVSNTTDCNDLSALSNPDADEICDNEDNDCNGVVDDSTALDTFTFYLDSDNDGFGTTDSVEACTLPSGYAEQTGDCDDNDNGQNPNAAEFENGEDDNCDGDIDEGTNAFDDDGDGYSEHDGDCDDTNSTISPDGTEVCDGVDNDCDGVIDESDATNAETWYIDFDEDGYGSNAQTEQACVQPTGYVANSDDCNDADSDVNPDATEVCDGTDNNCDGDIDEGSLGQDSLCPMTDCSDVDTSAGDGYYWVDPDSTGAFEVYCEVSASDGPWAWTIYDGLTAYWNFDGSIVDLIVGYTGSNSSSSSGDVPNSGFGQSVYFSNSDGTRIDLSSGPSFGSQGSIGYWSKCTSCSNNQIPLMTSDGSGWVGDQYYLARWYHSNTGYIISNGTSTCGDGVWKHNLYTYDSSGVRAYVNGVLVDSSTSTPHLSGLELGYIGSKPGFGTNGLEGNLDDIFFTSEVLDAASVFSVYQQGLQGRPLRWQ